VPALIFCIIGLVTFRSPEWCSISVGLPVYLW